MRARSGLVAVLLLAIGASGCIEADDEPPYDEPADDDPFSASKRIEIFDDRIETDGDTYYASGPRDGRPVGADPDWTMLVTNRGDREHAVTIVDTDNDTGPVYDHVLQPSQEAQFSFPYRGNFTLYDRLTSTRDSGLFVEYRVDFIFTSG